jgi:hypothetical protein
MHLNKEWPGTQTVQPLRSSRPADDKRPVPQITIRGDNNLINLGTSGVVKVNSSGGAEYRPQSGRNSQWPQQILDAIRVKAVRGGRSNNELCELAGRVLGRAVVTLERLSARELARVYEAVCSGQGA